MANIAVCHIHRPLAGPSQLAEGMAAAVAER